MNWSDILKREVDKSGLIVDGEDFDTIELFYPVIDSLSEEFYGKCIEAELEDDGGTIRVSMEFAVMSFNNVHHSFFILVDNALSLCFKSEFGTGSLIVELVLPIILPSEEADYEQ